VRDGASGLLVAGHDPADYAAVIRDLIGAPDRIAALGKGAVAHAERFGWSATATGLLDVYAGALRERELPRAVAAGR
jgi:D-inositol-3-phosphate glycosyltransferase